jgi:nucleotide-binding universal stress UspA family protein
MAYKTILVHLDTDAHCEGRVLMAARLAEQHQSHVIGVAATGIFKLPMVDALDGSFTTELAAHEQRKLRDGAERLSQVFDNLMKDLGAASFEARVEESEPPAAVLRHARHSDLLILASPTRRDPDANAPFDMAQDVFLRSGRPVLLVPEYGTLPEDDHHVLVAWSGTRESTRAVTDALPLLQRAHEVALVCLEGDTESSIHRLDLNDLRAWLSRQGVTAKVGQPALQGQVGEALLSCVRRTGCDLLVMGGYGHSRLTEAIFGGVTRTVLEKMPVPVLISH